MNNSTTTPEQKELAIKYMGEFLEAAQSNLNDINATLAKYPKEEYLGKLHVVVLNEVYTIGLEDDGLHLKLNMGNHSVAYDFETCKRIKKAFKGKDGLGREIQTSEITLRNVRNYLNERRKSTEALLEQYTKALDKAKAL